MVIFLKNVTMQTIKKLTITLFVLALGIAIPFFTWPWQTFWLVLYAVFYVLICMLVLVLVSALSSRAELYEDEEEYFCYYK